MLSDRNRGGAAAFKGHEYERIFGICRIVVAADRHVSGVTTKLAPQLEGACVDDWVEQVGALTSYFQLRRRKKQSWSRGLRKAFVDQRKLDPAAKLTLVVHLPELVKSLRKSRERIPGVQIEHFPDWLKPKEHIEWAGPVRSALRAACVNSPASNSDLEWIWKELSHSWENVRSLGKFRPIEQVLERLPDQKTSPLRCQWLPTPSWIKARAILTRVRGLAWEVRDGSLFYSTTGGFGGRMSCRSPDFKKLVNRLLSARPKTVSRFQELL